MKNKSQTVSKSLHSHYSWYFIPGIILILLVGILFYNYWHKFTFSNIERGLNSDFFIFMLIGVFAQLVDGTLGMGYGATSTSFLLSFGVPPAISSMGVHVAEMFTTGVSAISHHRFGNINKRLTKLLIIPGVTGAIIGSYLLSDVINGEAIKPYIAIYMVVLATIIIYKALRKKKPKKPTKQLGLLAIFGGFMDSVGGGGWGPIVTSTLIGRGRDPRYTIGSVNAAEFAIAFASGITFILFGGIKGWQVIAGLIAGGMIAAPIGAYLVNKIPRKPAMVFVGLLIIFLSLRTLSKLWF
jgi:uncharacterized membrane protein YfcA